MENNLIVFSWCGFHIILAIIIGISFIAGISKGISKASEKEGSK